MLGSRQPIVEIHTHYIPDELIDMIATGEGPAGLSVERRVGRDPLIVHDNGLRYPALEIFRELGARLAHMDAHRIDVSVISISPSLFLYWLEARDTAEVCRMLNDAAGRMVASSGGRLAAMATVPMNDPRLAADELHRAHSELGVVAVEIGTSVGEIQLDAPELSEFFGAAEELGLPVMLHPYISMVAEPDTGMSGFHLANVIGNPTETFVAASRMLVGGVFDRHPDLRVILVHGGGTLPYQLGRLQHAYGVREETSASAVQAPLSYLDNLRFDTTIFDRRALEYLISLAGAERVLLGTDLPFDMGDTSALEMRGWAEPAVADLVLGANAVELFGLSTR